MGDSLKFLVPLVCRKKPSVPTEPFRLQATAYALFSQGRKPPDKYRAASCG